MGWGVFGGTAVIITAGSLALFVLPLVKQVSEVADKSHFTSIAGGVPVLSLFPVDES